MSERAERAMKHPTIGIGLACGLILATAWPAFAQTDASGHVPQPGRFYLSATGFGHIERVSRDASGQLSGQTEGFGIAIGTFVSPRWSVEFEAAVPRVIDSGLRVWSSSTSYKVGVSTFESRSETRHRSDTGTVLLTFHPAGGRFRLAFAAGLAFVRFHQEYTDDQTYTDPPFGTTRVLHIRDEGTFFTVGPVLQIEASVRLARRVALVPYLRAVAFDPSYGNQGTFVFRPGAALRIHF